MSLVKTYNHKGWDIELHYDDHDVRGFFASSRHLISHNPNGGGVNQVFLTADDALNNIKDAIDEFLNATPQTWEELTAALYDSLEWVGYEDCVLNVGSVKTIVTKFMQARGDK